MAVDSHDAARRWIWTVYDRWLDVDEAPNPVLAYGIGTDETAAKRAAESWVAAMQAQEAS